MRQGEQGETYLKLSCSDFVVSDSTHNHLNDLLVVLLAKELFEHSASLHGGGVVEEELAVNATRANECRREAFNILNSHQRIQRMGERESR